MMASEGDAKSVSSLNLNEFSRELTELCRKHGLALAGEPELFVMEHDDYALEYAVDDRGRLVFT